MNPSFLYYVPAIWLAVAMFIQIILVNWLGALFRKRQIRRHPQESMEGLGPIESSLLGLMALMLSFTFSLSYSKFEEKRKIIIEEANDIGTAILRSELYPDSTRLLFRNDFREYIDARIEYYHAGQDEKKIKMALEHASICSDRMWKRSAANVRVLQSIVISSQMVPALNNMIDIVTTRDALRVAKVPPFLILVLGMLMLISSFLVGYGEKGKRHPVLIVGFALMTTIAVYLILELDRPTKGLLNHDQDAQRIVELRAMVE